MRSLTLWAHAWTLEEQEGVSVGPKQDFNSFHRLCISLPEQLFTSRMSSYCPAFMPNGELSFTFVHRGFLPSCSWITPRVGLSGSCCSEWPLVQWNFRGNSDKNNHEQVKGNMSFVLLWQIIQQNLFGILVLISPKTSWIPHSSA